MSGRSRDWVTLLGVLVIVIFSWGFVALTALVMPQLVALPAIAAAFICFVSFHYLVWGWLMSRPNTEDDDRREK